MFITVKYGNNQELFVNTNVFSIVLLEYLKEACCTADTNITLSGKEVLDLASESGDLVVELSTRGREYAKRFLDAKATYILIKTQLETEDSTTPAHQPLLSTVSEKFKTMLNNPKKKKVAVQNNEDQSTMSIDTASSDAVGAGGQQNNASGNTAKKAQAAAPAANVARAKLAGQPTPAGNTAARKK